MIDLLQRVAGRAGLAVVTLLAILWLGSAEAAYFPVMWGWSALAFLSTAALVLLLGSRARLTTAEWTLLIALAAFLAWVGASVIWSADPAQTVREVERGIVYLAGVFAVLLVAQRHTVSQLLGGLLAGITLISAYGLATHLFPDRFGLPDPSEEFGLAEPLGYARAVGIFAAIGTLLALGFATRAARPGWRALAAASTVVLLPTIYFTFGRGPLIALGLGLAAMLALDPRRLLLMTTVLALAPAPLLAVWLGSRSDALTSPGSPLDEATRQGHRLALVISALATAAAFVAFALAIAERRAHVGRPARRAYAAVLVLVLAVGVGTVFARFGGPTSLVERANRSLTGPPASIEPGASYDERFLNLSITDRLDFWSVAWDDYREHPWLGSGAGSYERYWLEHRPNTVKVRDAHSLYLEVLAEIGPLGLALLLTALAVPVAGAVKARRHPLVAAAFGAYVVYLFHAGIDWDWEMTAVTLAALVAGAATLVTARDDAEPFLSLRLRFSLLAVTVALALFSFVGLIGNSALAASEEAREDGTLEKAESEARKAIDWMPWSAEPWLELARAQRDQDDLPAARRSLRKGIAKDPDSWRLWYVLARLTRGEERDRAIARALALNPFSPQLAGLQAELAAKGSGARP